MIFGYAAAVIVGFHSPRAQLVGQPTPTGPRARRDRPAVRRAGSRVWAWMAGTFDVAFALAAAASLGLALRRAQCEELFLRRAVRGIWRPTRIPLALAGPIDATCRASS
jgi:hypothetical protein